MKFSISESFCDGFDVNKGTYSTRLMLFQKTMEYRFVWKIAYET